ncbi:SpoU rRNA methylase family protein [Mycobacterium avium 104]|uniref:SpoU rRNA methylase family protein n=1 Tax=Mycobacterium avium (strain 104) TaxID=243243 RepID=A0A0H3A2C2_MYCA1|nr:SpoU rRNA methylase family protein [Mycobacterium avium 104]
MPDSDARLASDLSLAVMRLARQLRFRNPSSPVSLSQLSALAMLANEGPMTPGALAVRERVRPPSMTRVIASLAEMGLVDRTPHPVDGRQVLVSVSEAGAELVKANRRARQEWLAKRLVHAGRRRARNPAPRGRSDAGPGRRRPVNTDALDVRDVDDPDDPRLDDFRDLNSVDRRPDLPSGKGLVIAEGVLVVQRMLASRFRPHALLGTERRLAELRDDLAGVPVPYYRTSADVMARVVGFHLNRGVLAAARRVPEPGVAELLAGSRTVAVLEGVNDHENLGAIFRNAAGLGVDAVIFGSGCADPLYRRAVRVSMGHALLVPYARATDWPAELKTLKEKGFRLLAMTPQGSACGLAEAMTAARGDRVAVLVGAEGPGLTPAALRLSDVRVRIPMSRGTDSLNVATAAALAFYERSRPVGGHRAAAGGGDGQSG